MKEVSLPVLSHVRLLLLITCAGLVAVAIFMVRPDLASAGQSTAKAPAAVIPEGRLVYCLAKRTGYDPCTDAVYIANGDGSNARSFPTPVAPTAFSWSPNGEKFLFSGYQPSCTTPAGQGLYIGTIGGQVRQVASGCVHNVSWAHDSGSIVYSDQGGTITLVSLGSLKRRVLLKGARCGLDGPAQRFGADPLLSPNGRELAYMFTGTAGRGCAGKRTTGIAITTLASGHTAISPTPGPLLNFFTPIAWTPSGSGVIAIAAGYNGAGWLVSTNGRKRRIIAPASEIEQAISVAHPLSPDGRYAALFKPVLGIADLSTGGFAPLDVQDGTLVGWSKDSASIMTTTILSPGDAPATTLTLAADDGKTEEWTGTVEGDVLNIDWSG